MRQVFVFLSLLLLSSCVLLFRTAYNNESENPINSERDSLRIIILNKFPGEGDREKDFQEWLPEFTKDGRRFNRENLHLFFLGDSIKQLLSLGIIHETIQLEYQDTIYSVIRCPVLLNNPSEWNTNILIKDEKIYRVFRGQMTIGDPNYRFELRVREVW